LEEKISFDRKFQGFIHISFWHERSKIKELEGGGAE
jgi:hypothetical protein